MNTHANKTQENKSQSVANEVSQKLRGDESIFQFEDNRPEALAQRKLQEMVNGESRLVTQRQTVIQRVNAAWNNNWDQTELGQRLTAGINGAAPPVEILQGLMNNFQGLAGDFNYTKRPADFNTFLNGALVGDCGTLARAFKAIGEGYYGIPGITTPQWGDCWVQAGPTPYAGIQPDCDGGTSWIFGSHTYASHGGTTYDILFCTNILAPKVDMGAPVNSEFFPDRDYYHLADGSMAYSIGAMRWYRIPPGLANQVQFLLINGIPMILRALLRLLMKGLNGLADGIGWIVNKVRFWTGNEDEGFGALGNLRDRND